MSIFEDEALTQGQRLVWFAVQELASGGVAPDNCSQIAGHMGSGRAHVSRALSALEAAGWVTREKGMISVNDEPKDRASQARDRDREARNRDSETRDSETRKGFPWSSLRFSPKKVHSTPISPSLLTPSQVCVESPSAPPPKWLRPSDFPPHSCELPESHRARWEHQPGDWTFEFAKAALVHMRELGLLTRTLEGDIDDLGEERYLATKWADTFRLLHEQDDYSQEEIRRTLSWLFKGGNFWTEQPAIRSVPPLRKKTRSGDGTKFDVMYQQAHSDDGHASRDDAKQRPEENWKRLARAAEAA